MTAVSSAAPPTPIPFPHGGVEPSGGFCRSRSGRACRSDQGASLPPRGGGLGSGGAAGFLLAATPALAEVGGIGRPGWSPADGRLGPRRKVLGNPLSLPGLAALAMVFAALRPPSAWLLPPLGLLPFARARLPHFARNDGGRVGRPSLPIALVGGMGAALPVRTATPPPAGRHP